MNIFIRTKSIRAEAKKLTSFIRTIYNKDKFVYDIDLPWIVNMDKLFIDGEEYKAES